MFVSEDGTVTGSINVAGLDGIEPKTDEARAQLDLLKADRDAGQEQAARDAQRLADQARAQDAQLRGGTGTELTDTRDAQGHEVEGRPQGGTTQQPASAADEENLDPLRTEAERAGVTVDKRWGADRLRQETDQAKAAKSQQSKKG